MRWIILTVVLAALCLGSVGLYRVHLNRQEAGERQAPPQEASKAPIETDSPFPQAAARNFSTEIAQVLRSLPDADSATRSASMDFLASLPGDAYPAIETASNDKQLPQTSQDILRDLVPLYKTRAARQKLSRDQRQACLRESLAAYEKYGHKYFRWDARVKAALTAFYQSDPWPDRTPAQDTWLAKTMDRLVTEDECDDPIAYFTYGLILEETHPDPAHNPAPYEAFGKAVELAAQKHWPAEWQALFKARWLWSDARVTAGRIHVIKPRPTLDEVADYPASAWPSSADKLDWAMQIIERQPLDKRFSFYERFHAAMEKSLPGGVEPLIFTGEFYTRYARGAGVADTVTPQGWKLFQERLLIARKALERAYEQQPDNPLIAADMISICMGLGDEPAETGRWFDRALAADPDNEQAVVRTLMYLEPKWHGSPAAMAALAQRLAATHNYRGKMPLALVKFHREIATYQPSHDAYLARPEVWQQMQSAFESYLVLFPYDRHERTAYAINCVQASKWDLANAQF